MRVHYQSKAEHIEHDADGWQQGLDTLIEPLGERIANLSELNDFKLFRLHPEGGRYVKGVRKAYALESGSLAGALSQLRDGHKKRDVAQCFCFTNCSCNKKAA